MTQTVPTTLAPAHSLEPLERLRLRDQLQDLWRTNVEQITALAVRFHDEESDDEPSQQADAVAQRLGHSRLNLTELEAAMRRLDAREYGICERCVAAIPFGELTAKPHRRLCAGCEPR